MVSHITLGTAQLGLDYGINNKKGKPHENESFEILEYAKNNNITSFDTAQAYGNSEKIIGGWIKQSKPSSLYLTSKVAHIDENSISKSNLCKNIETSITNSLNNLNVEFLDNILLHNINDLKIFGSTIFDALSQLKKDNIVNHIGCSVYDMEDLDLMLKYEFDTIQIPASIFNQSILRSSQLKRLKNNGIMVFARSAFVQGLIFMESSQIPKSLIGMTPYINELEQLTKKHNCSRLDIALTYMYSNPLVDSVVLGVETLNQLEEITSVKQNNSIDNEYIDRIFNDIPSELVDPRKWS